VALQGTLDTFALPDVLRLLASTKKSGALHLTGSRGTGSVWVDTGKVVGAEASGARHSSGAVDVLFELLRFPEGAFSFDVGTAAAEPSSPADVEPLLVEAEKLLEEWRGIEAVIPSMKSWVSLSPELPATEVSLNANQWRSIVAVGGGATVWAVGEALSLGEVPVCRTMKALVELGLVQVGSEPTAAESESYSSFTLDLSPRPAREELDRMASDVAGTEHAEEGSREPSLADTLLIDSRPAPASSAPMPVPLGELQAPPDDEVARQLANLSPQAARAVAAAAQASTDEERDAALAQVNEEEEPINRGLLLKFLSSVRS
jgi:hypothetical protein